MLKNTLNHWFRFSPAGRAPAREVSRLRTEAFAIFCLLMLVASGATGRPAQASGLAEVTPDDALLFVEVTRPAELWNALQGSELRQAIRTSFYADLLVNFTAATTNVIARSLTDRSAGEVMERYGLEIGIAFSPRKEKTKQLGYVVLLEPVRHTTEFQNLIRERIDQTFKARFPAIRISTDTVGDREIKRFILSKRQSWSLAFLDNHVVFGHDAAIRWILEGKTFLSDKEGYRESRRRVHVPDEPNIFCYAEVTEAAGRNALLYGAGTRIAAVLEVEGQMIRDKAIVSGNLKLPELGKAQGCKIGSAFPQGPYMVTQVSFASGSQMLQYFGVLTASEATNQSVDGIFTGTGFIATSPEFPKSSVIAAELVRAESAEILLKKLGFGRERKAWRMSNLKALVKDNILYLGRDSDIEALDDQFRSTNSLKLDGVPAVNQQLKDLPEAHGHSYMAPAFLKRFARSANLRQFEIVLERLSPAVARAEKTRKGVVIDSVSSHGYGIWLATVNLDLR